MVDACVHRVDDDPDDFVCGGRQIREGDRAIIMAPSFEIAHLLTTWDGSSPVDYALELTISPSAKASYRLLNDGAGPFLRDAALKSPTGVVLAGGQRQQHHPTGMEGVVGGATLASQAAAGGGAGAATAVTGTQYVLWMSDVEVGSGRWWWCGTAY